MTQITRIPQMSADFPFAHMTERVIVAAYRVHNTLGAGFFESVYVRALQVELRLVVRSIKIDTY